MARICRPAGRELAFTRGREYCAAHCETRNERVLRALTPLYTSYLPSRPYVRRAASRNCVISELRSQHDKQKCRTDTSTFAPTVAAYCVAAAAGTPRTAPAVRGARYAAAPRCHRVPRRHSRRATMGAAVRRSTGAVHSVRDISLGPPRRTLAHCWRTGCSSRQYSVRRF
jgi:hypothetical protein